MHSKPPHTSPPHLPQMQLYRDWLSQERGLDFDSFEALWRWSVSDVAAFWQSIWDYFSLHSPTPIACVLRDLPMPEARWFEGAQSNFARQVFSHVDAAHAAGQPALIARNEKGQHQELSWPQLRQQVAALALHLQAQGLQPGDRVAAYLPNVPAAVVAFLAVASVGGVWSVCAPDMGAPAVLDRFTQITPKVLIACDGVTYGHKDMDRAEVVAQMRAALPSVTHVIGLRNLGGTALAADAWLDAICDRDDAQTQAFEPLWLAFEHPLWIVYSSGTTGLPKPLVHGHGGIVLVYLAHLVLHSDLGPSYAPNSLGERYHWYSSTGWIMWNAQVAGLLTGSTCCLYDGNPAGPRDAPDWTTLWRFAAEVGVSFFGAGAAFYANVMKAGVDLNALPSLKRVRALGTTGSPLAPEVQAWTSQQFERMGQADMWWCNISGGTDLAGAFLGSNRELPMVAGEMQCRMLGCAVEAWNEQGRSVVNEVGELVCTRPLPSMPLYFWGDEGKQRYLSSYFEMYPGVWRHGDWLKITERGSGIIYGRSDATINRHGHRMGTSELYAAIEALPEVLDSLIVDLEVLGRPSYMPLFVVLRPGLELDDSLQARIKQAIRVAVSPRFIPDEIVQAPAIARTLSGKKQELPIKKMLLGQPADKVLNKDAMANPECLAWYADFAARSLRQAGGPTGLP